MKLTDVTYCELKMKDVVNVIDGRRLGRVIDMLLDLKAGRIKGIVLPPVRGFGLFRPSEDIYVPWKNVLRIGKDVIMVEVVYHIREERHKGGKEKGFFGRLYGDTLPLHSEEKEEKREEEKEYKEDDIKPHIIRYNDD